MNYVIGPHGFPLWEKDPGAVKDYALDWTAWLGADTINTSTWTVPTGITMDSSGNSPTHTAIWLSGGTKGNSYLLSNKVVTVGGRTELRTIEISVKKM